MSEKVGLGLAASSKQTFESFFVGENASVLAQVTNSERVWLFGESGVGKSHVLRALGQERQDSQFVVGDLSDRQTLCTSGTTLIDDIDELIGGEDFEYALFAAYEATDFSNASWIVAAMRPPQSQDFLYPDLASRMLMFDCLELKAVGAEDRLKLLEFWARDRSLQISQEVIQFLLDRIPRTQRDLWNSLNRIDRVALLENREVTIPLVRKALEFDSK